jgi:hypothetical protein
MAADTSASLNKLRHQRVRDVDETVRGEKAAAAATSPATPAAPSTSASSAVEQLRGVSSASAAPSNSGALVPAAAVLREENNSKATRSTSQKDQLHQPLSASDQQLQSSTQELLVQLQKEKELLLHQRQQSLSVSRGDAPSVSMSAASSATGTADAPPSSVSTSRYYDQYLSQNEYLAREQVRRGDFGVRPPRGFDAVSSSSSMMMPAASAVAYQQPPPPLQSSSSFLLNASLMSPSAPSWSAIPTGQSAASSRSSSTTTARPPGNIARENVVGSPPSSLLPSYQRY